LDNQVETKNQIVGLSTFIVARTGIRKVFSGQSVLESAWDARNNRGVTNEEQDVSSDTACMLASTSKLFTWTALSMLLDAGKFGLDDPVENALGFQLRNPSFSGTSITYRHLYSHTTGLKDDYTRYKYGDQCPIDAPFSHSETLEQSMRKVTDKNTSWSNWRPGSRYLYSNYATAIGALLVEKHSGMTFPDFTKKYIFEPLQMTATQWTRPSDGSACELYTLFQNRGYKYKTSPGGYCFPDYPSGQLWSTSGDLAKFSIAMLKRGNLGYTTADGADCLYSEEIGDLVFQKSSPSTGDGDSGLGWFVGPPYYDGGAGHDGSEEGVSTDLFVNLQGNNAVGFWANGELTNSQYASVLNRLLQTANAIGPMNNDYNASNPRSCTPTFSTAGSPTTPTPGPVPSPTLAPVTITPTCSDTTLRFKVKVNGKLRFKDCGWVRRQKNHCNKRGVSAACPSACGTCSTCADSPLRFKVTRSDGSKANKKCGWANSLRCENFVGVPEICRKKCGLCSDGDE